MSMEEASHYLKLRLDLSGRRLTEIWAGWVIGTPETEEAQNRLIAVKCNAVVVSTDYRK